MVKRITRPLTMLVLAASLGVAALSVQAQPAPGDMPPPPHAMHRGGHDFGGFPMQGRLLKEAGVTDAQRAQLKQIFEAAQNDLKGQRETGRQLHERMEALFTAPTVDANAVEQLRQQIAAQHEVASKRLTLAMIDASRVLTPEQRTKIAELKKQQREKMKLRMKDHAQHRKDRQGANPDNPVPQPFTER
jgi:Spy/CpxP family protein refolding chaperone